MSDAFEQWAEDKSFIFCVSSGDGYINVKEMAREAWQAAQAQAVTKARRSSVNPEAGDYANCVDDMPQAQAQSGERKCSECGNGEPDLSLYCVRCLNNDHWHLIDPAQAGEPVAVADKGVINWLDGKQFDHEADLYTQSAVNQQLLGDIINMMIAVKGAIKLGQLHDAVNYIDAAITAAQEEQ